MRSDLGLPYRAPCPSWTRRLEAEIGLVRTPGSGGKIWRLAGRNGGARRR
ncbi:MAG TPA: hypothetical protein VEL82_05480 [Thermoplasmata archaeon]|nr:hypothetical protein [Thermoplasmata archaeon]